MSDIEKLKMARLQFAELLKCSLQFGDGYADRLKKLKAENRENWRDVYEQSLIVALDVLTEKILDAEHRVRMTL